MTKIEQIICDHFNVSIEELKSDSRRDNLVKPRHLIWRFLRMLEHMTFKSIGDRYKRDHSTVVDGIKSVENQFFTNAEYKAEYKAIHKRILTEV